MKNLGLDFDSGERQMNKTCLAFWYQTGNIGHIRHCIATDACEALTRALI